MRSCPDTDIYPEVARKGRKMNWGRIYNPRIVRFGKIVPKKRRSEDLKEG